MPRAIRSYERRRSRGVPSGPRGEPPNKGLRTDGRARPRPQPKPRVLSRWSWHPTSTTAVAVLVTFPFFAYRARNQGGSCNGHGSEN
jgi:hypothetical protein